MNINLLKQLLFILSILFINSISIGITLQEAQNQLAQKKIALTDENFLEYIEKNDLNIVNLFLIAGFNPNIEDENGQTALMHAAWPGYFSIVSALLKKDIEINATDKNGWTTLYGAVFYCRDTSLIELLLKKGADANAKDYNEKSILMVGADNKCQYIVPMLIDYGAIVNSADKNRFTPLFWAIDNKKIQDVETYLSSEKPQSSNNTDTSSDPSIVLEQLKKGQYSIVKYLLNRGANVNTLDQHGRTPLLYAIKNGLTDITKEILVRSADVNCKDRNGNSPLMLACEEGNYEIVKTLFKYNINLHEKNKQGLTALDIAKSNGYNNIVQLIQKSSIVD